MLPCQCWSRKMQIQMLPLATTVCLLMMPLALLLAQAASAASFVGTDSLGSYPYSHGAVLASRRNLQHSNIYFNRRNYERRANTTICHLFFRAREENKRKEAQARIPSFAFDALRRKDMSIPFQFPLIMSPEDGDINVATIPEKTNTQLVTIRLLTANDLTTIVPMCVSEFGAGESTLEDLIDNFPWNKKPMEMKEYIVDWWENFILPSFIYWTFRLKIVTRSPQDHALLVATLSQQEKTSDVSTMDINENYRDTTKDNNNNNEIVGMVELSRQPPEPNRNPPAFPLPLWYKEAYCKLKKLPPPNGWVTNLLVGPNFRGQGYSKLLMAAAEGVAQSWGCSMIHLHCDANAVGGKVPQLLYKGLGYDMVEDPNSPYAWMGSEFSTKIFMVDGVALLYFRKAL